MPTDIPTREQIEQIEESQRICEAATGPWPHEGARQCDLHAFHSHAMETLPARNAQLLAALDLIAEKDAEIERLRSIITDAKDTLETAVCDHDYFSLLGDALMVVWKKLNEVQNA